MVEKEWRRAAEASVTDYLADRIWSIRASQAMVAESRRAVEGMLALRQHDIDDENGNPISALLVWDDAKGAALIARAQAGDRIADDVLRELAADCDATYDGRLPPILAAYVDGPKPKLKQGLLANDERNAAIVGAVQRIVDLYGPDITATRLKDTRRLSKLSACAIVADVLLREFRYNISVDAVEAVWERRPARD